MSKDAEKRELYRYMVLDWNGLIFHLLSVDFGHFHKYFCIFKTIDDFMHEKMNRKRISLGNYFPTRTHSNVAQYGASFRCVVQLRLNNKSNDTIMRSPKSVKPTNDKTYGVLYICVYVFLFSMWICQKGHLH